jgi:hypothetical protein
MPNRDPIVVGASADGVQALSAPRRIDDTGKTDRGTRRKSYRLRAPKFEMRAREAEGHSSVLRQLLLSEQMDDIGELV